MSKVGVIAKMQAQPGKRQEALDALQQLVDNAQGEAGTLIYAMHVDTADEATIWFYELYSDGDALAAHSGSDVMKQVGMGLREVMAGRPELHVLSPVAGKGLDL
jgi:quinol monooxygenase YgiN